MGVIDILFPPGPLCQLCGKPFSWPRGIPVCRMCMDRIPFVTAPFCVKCGKPLRLAADGKDKVCRDCAAWGRFFTLARSVGVYEGSLHEHIQALKYFGRRGLAEPLGYLMAKVVRDEPMLRGIIGDVDIIVPVPLHRSRLEERGYNQSVLLARALGFWLGLPLVADNLVRTRATSSQTKLHREARRDNVEGAFEVKRAAGVVGRNIVLVDDIFTTGTTADECARMLLRFGARSVLVLTVAVGAMETQWLQNENSHRVGNNEGNNAEDYTDNNTEDDI